MSKTFADFAHINPKIGLPAGANSSTQVSFIPMSDVTESGDWTGDQVRMLGTVRNGFTAFADGDVLIAKITPCFENGKGAHVVGLTNGIGFGSTEFHVLRARDGVLPRFVHHLAQSENFRRAAEAFMSGSAGQRRVPSDFFKVFLVPDLTFHEQQALSQVLDAVDTAIRQTGAIIEKLKQVKQGLLHDLLTRGIAANGDLRPPQSQAPDLYKDSLLGPIPKSWLTASLSEIATVRSGTTPSRSAAARYYSTTGIPWVKTLDLNEGDIHVTVEGITAIAVKECSCETLPVGSVLVAMYGGWEQIGRTALLRVAAATNQAISALVFTPGGPEPEYVLRAIQHGRPRWACVAASTRKDPNITKTDVASFQIALPTESSEQRKIVQAYAAALARIKLENLTLSKFREQKIGLMDDLLTGSVRVTPLLQGRTT